ncbi:DNA polymerase III subunits gamma and tau [hydrothermal vent metagenome]|uniref:DNA-directed DNA polymerase n=1 Tax=hydrothermal vent metagenome TaxID=652676 RepID=A0A3B1A0Y0_9ZZZZ
MSYLALARKWRPKNFSEMVGQEHVLRALINALDADRLHHAFLFTGTRGVGKTTIARILAKSINCEQGISSTPCGECSTCKEVDEGRFVDLIEVDAASRTKVEDTRDLLDNVQYAPSRGRYKVYLIDEVHMLSASSFNALLKTLEEPPPHVKFLFATTDPQKLPVTILSRCLQFNLRRLSVERISDYLQSLLDKENIPYEDGACKQLAIAADGSMRDGLSLLDQSIAYGAGTIKLDDVASMLGSFDRHLVISLVEKLLAQDALAVMTLLAKINEQVPDLNGVLDAILNLLHGIALYQQVPDACDAMLDEQGLALATIEALATTVSAEEIQLFYQIGLTGQRDLKLAPSIRSGLEMVLLRMLAFRPVSTSDTNISKKTNQIAVQPQSAENKTNEAVTEEHGLPPMVEPNGLDAAAINEVVTPSYNEAVQQNAVNIHSPWHEIVAALDVAGMDKQVAEQCVVTEVNNTAIDLALAPASAPFFNKDLEMRIQQSLQNLLGANVSLSIKMEEAAGESPSARAQRIEKEKVASAEAIIEEDADVKSLLDAFGGHLEPDSVQPRE